MTMRFGWMAAAAAMVCAVPAQAATVVEIAEVEPNNSIATAQALPVSLAITARVTGFLEGTSFDNVDFYSFIVDNANCSPERPACNLITAVVGGLNFNPPLSAFDPSGRDVTQGDGTVGFQIRDAAAGKWTLAVRRSSASAQSNYILVAGISAGVPEPASWAMMIVGVGLVGGASRRRRLLPASA